MAVPQNKISRARRNNRRSHHALSPATYYECLQCGEQTRRHHVCPSCGYYRNKAVFEVETIIDDEDDM